MAGLVGISNLNWKLSAFEIGQETEKLIEKARKVYNKIGSLKPQDVCFENTIKVLINNICSIEYDILWFSSMI